MPRPPIPIGNHADLPLTITRIPRSRHQVGMSLFARHRSRPANRPSRSPNPFKTNPLPHRFAYAAPGRPVRRRPPAPPPLPVSSLSFSLLSVPRLLLSPLLLSVFSCPSTASRPHPRPHP